MAAELALGLMTGLGSDPLATFTAVRDLGLPTVQIGFSEALDNTAGIAAIKEAARATGIEITTVFCGFAGESYADIPTVQATVGLMPEATRALRVARTSVIAEFARKLGVARVAAHIGYIPEEPGSPQFEAMVQVVRGICDELAGNGQVYALETGQETAAGLRDFIEAVKRPNLKVNFDPANMILYGKDQPIPALDVLYPWIDGVHCKDGRWPTEPDQLGHETPLGEGDVNIPVWLEKLVQLGFRGTLTIEREISGEQQRSDVLKGRHLLESILARK